MSSVLQPFHDSITAELSALRQEVRSMSTELDTSGSSTLFYGVNDLVIPMHGSWWTRCKSDRTMRLELWCKWFCCGFDRFPGPVVGNLVCFDQVCFKQNRFQSDWNPFGRPAPSKVTMQPSPTCSPTPVAFLSRKHKFSRRHTTRHDAEEAGKSYISEGRSSCKAAHNMLGSHLSCS